jgi:hypothetical protein
MDLLSDILNETEWTELTDCVRRKVPAIWQEPKPERFRSLWSDWELDAICRFTLLPESDTFRLFKMGKQVPAAAYQDRRGAPSLAALRQLWSSGVSINFARLELFSNPVLALVRQLEAAMRMPTRVHFFATPARSQGLGAHADDGEVLVLQIQGEKTWDIYRTAERWRPGGPDTKTALQGHTPEVVTLKPGCWLYLPYGIYHEVRNDGDVPSTHFTIGFHALSWCALMERALEIAGGASRDLTGIVPVPGPLAVDESEITRRLCALRPFLDAALDADRYGHAVPSEELTSREVLESGSAKTRFSLQRDRVGVRAVSGGVELNLPYRSIPLRLRAEFAPAIEWMARHNDFEPTQIDHDGETALLLCKFLVNVGVLRVAGPAPAH